MKSLFDLSARFIDSGVADSPVNRVTNKLSELAPDLAIVESFSHSLCFDTEDGLVVIDCSGAATGNEVVKAIRGWSDKRFNTLVYTHGHIDHIGGSGGFVQDAENKKHPTPSVLAHSAVPVRMQRYKDTDGYNQLINARQFRGFERQSLGIGGEEKFLPKSAAWPTVTYEHSMSASVGETSFKLFHDKGETDDHTWLWLEDRKTICAGDFFIWNFPNAGNPQKVQRYPREWANALRKMQALKPEYFLPAHGLPIMGAERINKVLDEVASALEYVFCTTLELMNAGYTLNQIINEVKLPKETMEKPYLRPLYDEPEFVVNNIWRQFGGWYNGNPAYLKPAEDRKLALEIAKSMGGVKKLVDKALDMIDADDLRCASHFIEWAWLADPEDQYVCESRGKIYEVKRKTEKSLMAKGIYRYASQEALAKLEDKQ